MEFNESAFNTAILFALFGSLLGSLIAMDIKRHGLILSIVMLLAGMVLSVSVADYFFSPSHPWLYSGVGIFCGVISPALLDALKVMAPKAVKRLINVVIAKLEKMIGVIPDDKDK